MLHKRWSTYGAFAIWGSTGFMAQPSLASLAVHILLVPVLLVGTLWLAHHEARKS